MVHLLERHVRGDDRHGAAHPQLSPHDVRHLHREHLTPRRLHDPQVGVAWCLYDPQVCVNRGIFLDFFMYCIQHCFICLRPSDSTV